MDQSRAGWAGFAIQFVNGVQIGLTREVVYQVGHLAVDRTQAQRIARRRHDQFRPCITLAGEQRDAGICRENGAPAPLVELLGATLDGLIKVRSTCPPAAVGRERQGDALCSTFHCRMKARQRAAERLRLRNQAGLGCFSRGGSAGFNPRGNVQADAAVMA